MTYDVEYELESTCPSCIKYGSYRAVENLNANADTGKGKEAIVLWQDKRIHSAGVTATLPLTTDFILTGSYDDNARFISISSSLSSLPKYVAQANLGGGVCRLKVIHHVEIAEG